MLFGSNPFFQMQIWYTVGGSFPNGTRPAASVDTSGTSLKSGGDSILILASLTGTPLASSNISTSIHCPTAVCWGRATLGTGDVNVRHTSPQTTRGMWNLAFTV